MTGSSDLRRATMLGPALVLGLLVLVWTATAGPVGVMSPSGRRRDFEAPAETPTADSTFTPPPTLEETTGDVVQTLDLSWLGTLAAWGVLLGMAAAALLAGRWAWQRRWRRPEPPPDVDFEVVSGPQVAQAVTEDLQAQLDAVRQGTPRNGIVRCWLRLEKTVADAGVPPRRHETSTEFTVRVLHALDVDPRALGELAALYREARFSEHDLGEPARTKAQAALEQLHEDLRAVGGVR